MTTTTRPPATRQARAGFDDLGEGVVSPEYGVGTRRGFRADIQGLRAVAVLAVVLYHAHVPFVSGGYVGVDVFFVISGFLITGHLLGEVERTGRVSVTGFYARRIRRLLPAALLVVCTTILVSALWGPALQARQTARDGLYAAFYAMNYHLAADGIDYQQADASPSPFQHFWSLAVEEQFYVFWPLLVLVVALVTRRTSATARRVLLAVVVVAAIVVSLLWSIETTASNAPLAYYSLQTRAWELGVGALVAIMAPLLDRVPALLAAPLTWVGLALVVVPVFVFDDRTPFPGWLAALPVGGVALVIAAGVAARPAVAAERLLGRRVLQFLGAVSYGWYLWHWPALVLGPSVFGQDVGWGQQVLLTVIALWFAALTYLLVEQPSVRLRFGFLKWAGTAVALSCVVVLAATAVVRFGPVVAGNGVAAATLDLSDPAERRLSEALAAGATLTAVPSNLVPGVDRAVDDGSRTTTDGCHLGFTTVAQPDCVYGDTSSDRTIVLFGDSHAEQWFGALDKMAEDAGYRLLAWTKAACPVADTVLFNEQLNRDYTECGTWRAQRLAAIASVQPDIVIASQADTLPGPHYDDTQWAAETAATVTSLQESAGRVVFIDDTPRPQVDVPTCVADHLDSVSTCNSPAPAVTGADPDDDFGYAYDRGQAVQAALGGGAVRLVDPTAWFCTEAECPVVVGNVLVYRDASHMTQTYSKALEPLVAAKLDRILEDAP